MNPLNWLRKAAAQALDLAAEGYGALASWCVRTSEQLDPYTADDYRHARKIIDQVADAFPRAELRDLPDEPQLWKTDWPSEWDAQPTQQTSYWFNESDWQPRVPRDGGEHRYDEACGGCTCGWPTGKHPSETGDE